MENIETGDTFIDASEPKGARGLRNSKFQWRELTVAQTRQR